MDGIQSSQFLSSSNFDDPGLLTYLINENESGASIVPIVPPPTTSSSSCSSNQSSLMHQHQQDQHAQQVHHQHGFSSNSLPNSDNRNNSSQSGQQYHGHGHGHGHGHDHHQQQSMSHQHHSHHQQMSHHQQQQMVSPGHEQHEGYANNHHHHHHGQPRSPYHHVSSTHAHQQQFSPNLLGSNSSNSQQQVLFNTPSTSNSNRSNQVTMDHHSSNQVTMDHRSSDQVTMDHRSSNQVTMDHHPSNQVTMDHLSSNQVTMDDPSNFNLDPSHRSPGGIDASTSSMVQGKVSNSSQMSRLSSPPSKIFPDTIPSETGHLITPRKDSLVIVSDPEASTLKESECTKVPSLVNQEPEKKSPSSPVNDDNMIPTIVKTPNHRGPGRPRKIRPTESDPKSPKLGDRKSQSKERSLNVMQVDLDQSIKSGKTESVKSGKTESITIGMAESITSGMAEKKTIVILKIIDQVILDGEIVKESEREERFERSGGLVFWPSSPNTKSSSASKVQPSATLTSTSSGSTKSRNPSGQSGATQSLVIPSPPKMKDILTAASSRFRPASSQSTPRASSQSTPRASSQSTSRASSSSQSTPRASSSSQSTPKASSQSRSSHSGVERAREKRRKESKRSSSRTKSGDEGSKRNKVNHPSSPRTKPGDEGSKRNKVNHPSSPTPKVKMERSTSQDSLQTMDDSDEVVRMRETASTLLALSSPDKDDSKPSPGLGSLRDHGPRSIISDTSSRSMMDHADETNHHSLGDDKNHHSLSDEKNHHSLSDEKNHHSLSDEKNHHSLSDYNFHEVTFEPLRVGSHVMAKWSDKNFYAGKLVKSMGDYKWNILFEDGGRKVVHESDIIAIPFLTIGQIVMITFTGQQLCLRGCIKDVTIEETSKLPTLGSSSNDGKNCTMYYHVEYTVDSTKIVVDKFTRGDVFLTAELATPLLSKQSKSIVHQPDSNAKFADVDLNNIIPKRSRVSAQACVKPSDGASCVTGKSANLDSLTDDSETESTHSDRSKDVSRSGLLDRSKDVSRSGVQKGKKVIRPGTHSPKISTPSKPSIEDTTSQSSGNSSSSSGIGKRGESGKCDGLISQKEPGSSQGRPMDEGNRRSTGNKTSQGLANSLASSLTPEETLSLLGPVPIDGSSLFQGIAFLLTTADPAGLPRNDSHTPDTPPFDIYYLMRQVEFGGGRVYQNLSEAQDSSDCKEIVLLAYTYLRTVKYMQCLAAGVPCLMHTWIIDCCRQNTLLKKDDYLLPSGYSLTTNSLPSDRMVFKKSAQLFKGVRFMLVSKNQRHSESWTPVLNAANAIIVDDLPSSPGTATRKASNSVDVIISDASCPSHILKKAKQLKIPVVSSEYVVQCLINGKRLPYDAHEKFNISFKS